ncbi:MAG: hypothetical protein ACOYMN_22835 [Roseimicrobium sp.]
MKSGAAWCWVQGVTSTLLRAFYVLATVSYAWPLWSQNAAPDAAQAPPFPPLPHPEIAPPELTPAGTSWWFIGFCVVGIIALTALMLWLLWRKRPASAAVTEPPLPRAIAQLEALRTAMDITPAQEFAHRVSVIVRDYLQARYAVPAPYRTTPELYGPKAVPPGEGVKERFEPLAEFYDKLEFAPTPSDRADVETLITAALEALQEEGRRVPPPALPPPLPASVLQK